MSDKIIGFTVVLEGNVSEEYGNHIKDILGLIKNVISVETHVEDLASLMAEIRVKRELTNKLWEALK